MAAPAVAAVAKFIPWDKVIKWGLIAIAILVAMAVMFWIVVITAILSVAQQSSSDFTGTVGDIPEQLMPIYRGAAETCPGLDWSYVAAIGYTESRHASGGSTLNANLDLLPPLINPQSVHFGYGRYENARGPMQFLPSTFAAHATDGNGDGVASIDNYADAIYTAVAMLCSMNAGQGGENPGDPLYQALWHYGYRNSSSMQTVLSKAAEYRALAEAAAASGNNGSTVAPGGIMPMPSGPVGIEQTTLVTTATGASVRVYTPSAPYWQALFNLARQQGVPLSGGGWRDAAAQIAARRRNGCPDIYTSPASSCHPPTARPGSSMHERGVAIDFTCPSSTIGSRSGPCWNFLVAHGAQFGVSNLPSEPWHWSANGN